MTKSLTTVLILAICSSALAQGGLLARRYREGETLVYQMKGVDGNRRYEIRATGVVKRTATGSHVEEYAWSHFVVDGSPVDLAPNAGAFRQVLSLDPGETPALPNLQQVNPRLIGPITDFMTFYADLWLAARVGRLSKPGDRVYYPIGTPASWADGSQVVFGEDSIDFDMTLSA